MRTAGTTAPPSRSKVALAEALIVARAGRPSLAARRANAVGAGRVERTVAEAGAATAHGRPSGHALLGRAVVRRPALAVEGARRSRCKEIGALMPVAKARAHRMILIERLLGIDGQRIDDGMTGDPGRRGLRASPGIGGTQADAGEPALALEIRSTSASRGERPLKEALAAGRECRDRAQDLVAILELFAGIGLAPVDLGGVQRQALGLQRQRDHAGALALEGRLRRRCLAAGRLTFEREDIEQDRTNAARVDQAWDCRRRPA